MAATSKTTTPTIGLEKNATDPNGKHTPQWHTTPESSDLPSNQPPEEIKTIAIALQRPHLARPAILPPQLLRHQQAPIPRDALDPRPDPSLGFQRHDLVGVQPVRGVEGLEVGVPAGAAEARVEGFEVGEDGGEEALVCDVCGLG